MSAAGWALLVAAVLGMGMVVSTSTRFVVARLGGTPMSSVDHDTFVSSAPSGAQLPDAEAAIARLLDVKPRSVRVVRDGDEVVHCVVVVPPQELGDVVTQLSAGFDGAFLERHRMAGSRVVVTAEAA